MVLSLPPATVLSSGSPPITSHSTLIRPLCVLLLVVLFWQTARAPT